MRLDKFLCELNIGTRSQVKKLIRQKHITVNGRTAETPEQQIDEGTDIVAYMGEELQYRPFVYYMMNKPAGVVCATKDPVDRTVLDLLIPCLDKKDLKRAIVPAGRLDKDTEGLLLLTDDGALVHNLLSPGKHVDKTYQVWLGGELSKEAASSLEQGVDIGEKNLTLPAKVERVDNRQILLTIHEGKFHQVKRMLQAVGNEVTGLKRVSFGPLVLDTDLEPGKCRELTEGEVLALRCGTSAGIGTVDGHRNDTCSADMEMDDNKIPVLDGIEAIIFDMDGTLVDSMWMWRDIDIEYLGKFGIPLPEDLQSRIEGMSFHETAIYFKEHFDIPDSIEQMKDDWNAMAWDKYEKEVPLKPGAEHFLKQCRERGIRLGIATSNSRALVENIAAVHGLHDYFGCIMTGTDVERGKPAPDIYLAVAKGLGVPPERCLVFEDIVPGIWAGKNAGMKVCAVEDAYSKDSRAQKKACADYYIEDYTEVCFA